VLAAAHAADPVGLKMMQEIMRLPIARQTCAFRDADVFRLMAQLNPSLLTALKRCRWSEIERNRMGDF